MNISALILNCTLKKSPEVSNTQALIHKAIDLYSDLGVKAHTIRIADHDIAFGVSDDEGGGDEWPSILDQILAADILIIATPIWFGVRSSIASMVIERLDGTYMDGDPVTGQFPLYGKVGGVIVTGNEDGAHTAAGTTLFNLSHLGCTIAPNSDSYWVGDAGPGPSYIEAGADRHLYTNKTIRYLTSNTAYFAQLLKYNPIPTNLNQLIEDAKAVSGDPHPEEDSPRVP